MRCISSIISEDSGGSSSFVYSLIVSPIAAEYNFTMETKEAVWTMPSVSVKTRFLLHCFEIESTFMDHGKVMLVEFGLDNSRVYILLDDFPNNLVTDCLFHSDECTPWDE